MQRRGMTSLGRLLHAVAWRARATRVWLVCGILGSLLLSGCRRPDPVYDRVPRPLSTRDVVRAERRDGVMLSELERATLVGVHDRYLEVFEALRQNELVPFAAQLRSLDLEDIRNDERLLRSLVARHLGIIARIEALDASFLEDVAEALGPARERFVSLLRHRRAIDRASALSAGDGGRVLLDVRQLMDYLALDASERTAVEPLLIEFDSRATTIAMAIAREQATLPVAYLGVIERKGPAAQSVDRSLRDDARREAIDRANAERFAASRKDLEVHLLQYANLVDRTIEEIAALLDESNAALLRRRLLRLRIDDDKSRGGDVAVFEAMVASRAMAVSPAERQQIDALVRRFLAEDEARLRESIETRMSLHTPGVLDPLGTRSGPEAVKTQRDRLSSLERERAAAATKFREEFMALVPVDVQEEIESLRGRHRDDFVDKLAELVGPGRVAALVQRRPRGFGDRDPPEPAGPPRRSGDPGELRLLLAPAPDDAAIQLLCDRSRLDDASRLLVRQIFEPWRERWEATREPARARVQELMGPIMASMSAADERAFETAVQRLISGVEELRRQREVMDQELVESLDAALPVGLDPAARELWLWERAEASRRLAWRDLPFEDLTKLPPESTVGFMDSIARAGLPPERAADIVGALAPSTDALNQATERLRSEALATVRRAMALVIEGRMKGIRESEALRESRPEVRRIIAPMREAASALVALRLEALAAVVAVLPVEEGRRLREQFLRAAYPRLLDERRPAERLLAMVANDPSLSEEQLDTLERIRQTRYEARDAALDRLLSWASVLREAERPLGDDLGNRDAAGRRHPELGSIFFARDEADARAVRAALGMLTPDQLLRHGALEDYFNESLGQVRWLD